MGHDDEGDTGPFLNRHQLELGMFAQLLVQSGRGFVQEQQFGLPRQRPGQCHPLALTARNLVRFALGKGGQLHKIKHLGHPSGAICLAHPLLMLQPIADVRLDRHMREDRIGLKHHVNRALPRGNARHVATIKEDLPCRRFLEPGKHAQQRGLAASRSAQKGKDLALSDGQGNILDRLKHPEAFRDAFDPQERFFQFSRPS